MPNKGDTAFMTIATALVILMTIPGLALFYGGLVRSKNMLSVLMQVFMIFSLISVLWVVYGYSAAFTAGNPFFLHLATRAGETVEVATVDTLPESPSPSAATFFTGW